MNNNYYSNGQPQLQSQPGSPLFTNGVETPNQSRVLHLSDQKKFIFC